MLLARGSRLPLDDGPGYVVVFDDVTQVISAQRAVAWGEVARRLAHEIKNPLTPIQLSAERLQMKLADKLPPAESEVLRRGASTIVNQEAAMKRMVDDFREFARKPATVMQAIDRLEPTLAQPARERERLAQQLLRLLRHPTLIRTDTRVGQRRARSRIPWRRRGTFEQGHGLGCPATRAQPNSVVVQHDTCVGGQVECAAVMLTRLGRLTTPVGHQRQEGLRRCGTWIDPCRLSGGIISGVKIASEKRVLTALDQRSGIRLLTANFDFGCGAVKAATTRVGLHEIQPIAAHE